MLALLSLITVLSLTGIISAGSTSPTWAANSAIKAGKQTLFASLKSAGYNQDFPINFPSMFSSGYNPLLAYGLSKYRGNDYLVQQSFVMTTIDLGILSFTVNLKITNITSIILMEISYMAVDGANFNYYFNAFVDVPLNYNSLLTNFSSPSSSLQYHYEVVDYANDQNPNFPSLSQPSTYVNFSPPYTQYRIALFVTSLSVTSVANTSFFFDVSSKVIDSNTYYMNATLGYNATISYIKFSQVFFDSSQFSVTSNKYFYFQEWAITNTSTTNFFAYNSALATNFMMGLKSFTTSSGLCSLQYQWITTTVNSTNGAQVQISTPSNATCGLSGHTSTILFMMSWTCPGGFPYFDLTSQMCLSSCNPYTYLNSSDSTCYPCLNTACYTCDANNSNICIACATNQVIVSNTCICDTSAGGYLLINGQCYSCNNLEADCTMCSYAGNTSQAYNAASFTCLTCNATIGRFIDPNNKCVSCSVSNCATCIGYATCSVCQASYGVTSVGSCSTCPITGCQTCLNLTACSTCQTGYTKINNLCYTCPTSCTCGGYTLPKYTNGDCSTVCGDGIVIFPYQACDDGNLNGGDGCSTSCQIETYSSCSGQPSTCYFTSTVSGQLISSQVSSTTCNVITFNFKLTPSLLLFSNSNISWTNAIAPQNTSILYNVIGTSYSNGVISQTYSFNKDIQNANITFKIQPLYLLSSTYLFYTTASYISGLVVPNNNIPAVYISESTCKNIKITQNFFAAQTAISYLGLLLSVFSCKIIGLEMFGVLQLSYFSLSNYDFVPPALIGLLQRKEINGINIGSSATSSTLPARIVANGYTSSDFLANFNIMLLLTAIIGLTGLAMYMITYLINKQSMDDENMSEALQSADNSHRGQPQVESRSQYWHKVSKYILKEVLLTFIIFNIFNISYSAGLQIKYIDQVNSFSIICLLLTLTLVLAISVSQIVTSKDQFGEYIQKFKKEKIQSRYMIATVIYRFLLGFLLAVINEWVACGIVYTFVSSAFLTYICFFEPFTDQFQNMRSKFIHSVHVLILFVNFYYRVEASSNSTQSSELYVPAYLQITAVAVAVFGSSILLGYQFYVKVKSYFSKSASNGNASPKGQDCTKENQANLEETIEVIKQ